MITRREIHMRLRDAQAVVAVSDAARARHLAAIDTALSGVPVIAPRRRPRGLRRAVSLAMVVGILALPGLALAGQHTVPGDVLYPIKRVVERVWVIVDDDVAAEHRIRELEVLLDRNVEPTVVEKAVEAAIEASEQLSPDDSLHDELAEILSALVASTLEDDLANEQGETEEEEGPATSGDDDDRRDDHEDDHDSDGDYGGEGNARGSESGEDTDDGN